MPSLANCRLDSGLINLIRCQTQLDGFCDSRIRKRTVFCPPSPTHLALCHARNLRKPGRQQGRASLLQRRQDNLEFQGIKSGRAIMSRFLIAMFVGATIVAAISTSASAWHCLARAPNGASGTAFGVILGRAQSISLRRCIHRGGGTGCRIVWCRPY
jgi:hypothetical protein